MGHTVVQDLVVVFFLRASFATANTLLTELKQPLDGSSELISGNGPDGPYTGLLEAVPPPPDPAQPSEYDEVCLSKALWIGGCCRCSMLWSANYNTS
jgi:hypothetical protein